MWQQRWNEGMIVCRMCLQKTDGHREREENTDHLKVSVKELERLMGEGLDMRKALVYQVACQAGS